MKRSHEDQLNEYVCSLIEDGQVHQLQRMTKLIRLEQTIPPCGSHLLALAPCIEMADLLINQGISLEDDSGRLLSSCYDPIAEYLVQRNTSIQSTLEHIQGIMPYLSPTTKAKTQQRKSNLIEWKQAMRQTLRHILVEDCGLIKDLTTLILPYLE